MRCLVLLILIVVEIAYLIAGGFIFMALESPKEQQQKEEQRAFNLTSILDNFTALYPCVSGEDLLLFTQRIINAEKMGLITPTETNAWDIHGSIFFAMTVVTTIGYGNLSPTTTGGQIFCCFYAVIGIPFTMVMLLGLGDVLQKMSKRMDLRMMKKRPRAKKIVRTVAMTTIGIVMFLVIPAAIFTRLEGWGYGTAMYYGIITTATIGFGDYVAGFNCVGNPCWFYRISVGIWIYMGLAWLAGVIGSIQEAIQHLVTKGDKESKETPADEDKKRKENGTVAETEIKECESSAEPTDAVTRSDSVNIDLHYTNERL